MFYKYKIYIITLYIYYSLVDKKPVTGLRKIKDYVKQKQRKTLLQQDLLWRCGRKTAGRAVPVLLSPPS